MSNYNAPTLCFLKALDDLTSHATPVLRQPVNEDGLVCHGNAAEDGDALEATLANEGGAILCEHEPDCEER